MSKEFSRSNLYELVWSKPRTSLAKDLGVSNVAIGKHCARAYIPMPPAGYWAKLSSGKKVSRAPLPLRLPGQSDVITIGRSESWSYPPREDPSEPPVPHAFVEDIEEQVREAMQHIGHVVASRDLRSADPTLSRLMTSEAKLREKHKEWSYYKPNFDDVAHQRQLRIFNSIARALGTLFGRQEVSDEEEWVRGRGTLHYLVQHLSFGGASVALRFQEPGDQRGERRTTSVKATTLRADSGTGSVESQEWSDKEGVKLEAQLTDIVKALLRQAELTLRASEKRRFESCLNRRQELLARNEARRVEDERQRQATIEAHRAKVRDEIVAIAGRFRLARDIRATVVALRSHPEVGSDCSNFEAWATRALEVAGSIDPMTCPLEQVLRHLSIVQD